MRSLHRILLMTLLIGAAPVVAQDRAGADHPLVPRYEGARIANYRASSLDEIFIPTAAVSDEGRAPGAALEALVMHLDYTVVPAVSPLAIARHYEAVLAANGFEILFSCSGPSECGRDMDALISNSGRVAPSGFSDAVFSDRLRVVVARRRADWVLLRLDEASDRSLIYAVVAENSQPQR
ncbi:hypothetical protein D3C71_883130 [compost metagenome]